MTKKIVLTVSIVVLGLNINAQITDWLLSKNKNVAYFDSLTVYKNLYPVQRLHERVFIRQIKDTLFVNDLKLIVQSQEKDLYDVENCYQVTYICSDLGKNRYHFTIQYAYGHSYEACLIAENTDMRYGFAHTF